MPVSIVANDDEAEELQGRAMRTLLVQVFSVFAKHFVIEATPEWIPKTASIVRGNKSVPPI